jgi:hypothetical protein
MSSVAPFHGSKLSAQPIQEHGKPGDISTNTLINPVLETFMQTQNNSCMGCHSFATTAQPNSTTATVFSFMFGNAQGK